MYFVVERNWGEKGEMGFYPGEMGEKGIFLYIQHSK